MLPRLVPLRQNHPRSLPNITEQNGVPYHHPTPGNASSQLADGPKKKNLQPRLEQDDRGIARALVTRGACADKHSLRRPPVPLSVTASVCCRPGFLVHLYSTKAGSRLLPPAGSREQFCYLHVVKLGVRAQLRCPSKALQARDGLIQWGNTHVLSPRGSLGGGPCPGPSTASALRRRSFASTHRRLLARCASSSSISRPVARCASGARQ